MRLGVELPAGRTCDVYSAESLGADTIWRHEKRVEPSNVDRAAFIELEWSPTISSRFFKAVSW